MKAADLLNLRAHSGMTCAMAIALMLSLGVWAGHGVAQEAIDPVAPAEQQEPVVEAQEPSIESVTPDAAVEQPVSASETEALPEPSAQPEASLDSVDETGDAEAPTLAEPTAGSDLPEIEHGLAGHDLSPWGMFMMADLVVKSVMVGLTSAALVTWIIWLGKWLQLSGARVRARRALRVVSRADSLETAVSELSRRKGVGVLLVRAADEEMTVSAQMIGRVGHEGIKERVTSRLSRIEVAAGRKISQGTGILASIGSVSPFVGLFGTVWGIMNSFIGIAESQTTNLAVVAPGIAEALLATALGLVAAIPAVLIYNGFARSITAYRQLLSDVSAGIERLVSRDLDRSLLAAERKPQAQAAE